MKTFTEVEKREIEQRIQAACAGTKFEGPKPAFFITAGNAVKLVKSDNRFPKPQVYFSPCFQVGLVNEAGQITSFGIEGQN